MPSAETTLNLKLNPEIDKEALLEQWREALLSASAVIIRPGETLVIRLKDWSADQVEYYQEDLDRRGLPFRVLAVIGDELAVATPEPTAT